MDELKRILFRKAGLYNVADDAPSSYSALTTCSVASMTVWSGASDRTIFVDPRANWAFRAWHDKVHLKYGYQFDLKGEILTARKQIEGLSDQYAKIILIEVVGQAKYFKEYGMFPSDQVKFLRLKIKHLT